MLICLGERPPLTGTLVTADPRASHCHFYPSWMLVKQTRGWQRGRFYEPPPPSSVGLEDVHKVPGNRAAVHASLSSTAAPPPMRFLQGWGTQGSQQGAQRLTLMKREERHREDPRGGCRLHEAGTQAVWCFPGAPGPRPPCGRGPAKFLFSECAEGRAVTRDGLWGFNVMGKPVLLEASYALSHRFLNLKSARVSEVWEKHGPHLENCLSLASMLRCLMHILVKAEPISLVPPGKATEANMRDRRQVGLTEVLKETMKELQNWPDFTML